MEQNLLLKIQIIKKKKVVKSTGVVFYTYSSPMYLSEVGKEELVKHWIDVKFSKKMDQTKIQSIKGKGYIYCRSEDVIAPEYYIVKDKYDMQGNKIDGKKEYPHMTIMDFDHFEANKRVLRQSSFITDEEDTEESTID